jgi:hypothetical protein
VTDDQQFLVALLTIVAPTIASLLALRQARETHTAVNGVLAKGTRRARAQGRAQGRAEVVPPRGPEPPESP